MKITQSRPSSSGGKSGHKSAAGRGVRLHFLMGKWKGSVVEKHVRQEILYYLWKVQPAYRMTDVSFPL